MRIIALEEHFATPGLMEGPGAWLASYPQWVDPLLDIGGGRVAAMDAAGIDMAVLSLTAPGVEQLEGPEAVKLARESNDILGKAVREHSGRLAGFATVPLSAPGPAADELERAVREYGFLGAVIRPWPPWPWLRPPTSSRTAPANPATSPHTANPRALSRLVADGASPQYRLELVRELVGTHRLERESSAARVHAPRAWPRCRE